MAEETLLHDILTPSERIRTGYETTEVRTRDGALIAGPQNPSIRLTHPLASFRV